MFAGSTIVAREKNVKLTKNKRQVYPYKGAHYPCSSTKRKTASQSDHISSHPVQGKYKLNETASECLTCSGASADASDTENRIYL